MQETIIVREPRGRPAPPRKRTDARTEASRYGNVIWGLCPLVYYCGNNGHVVTSLSYNHVRNPRGSSGILRASLPGWSASASLSIPCRRVTSDLCSGPLLWPPPSSLSRTTVRCSPHCILVYTTITESSVPLPLSPQSNAIWSTKINFVRSGRNYLGAQELFGKRNGIVARQCHVKHPGKADAQHAAEADGGYR